MKTPLEKAYSKSLGASSLFLGVVAGLAVVFLALFLTAVVDITKPEEKKARKIAMYEVPPPPPEPPEVQDPEPPEPSPIEMEITLNPREVNLAYQPIDAKFQPKVSVGQMVEFDFSKIKRPGLMEGLENLVFDRDEVDEVPRKMSHSPPDIPSKYRRKHESVYAVVQILVGPDGKPLRVFILDSTDIELEEYFKKWAMGWRYTPGKKGGKKVSVWIKQRVTVKLGSASPFSL